MSDVGDYRRVLTWLGFSRSANWWRRGSEDEIWEVSLLQPERKDHVQALLLLDHYVLDRARSLGDTATGLLASALCDLWSARRDGRGCNHLAMHELPGDKCRAALDARLA